MTLAFLSSTALAETHVSGDDQKVAVTAEHAKWTGQAPVAVHDTVEIPLEAGATANRAEFDDKTIKRVEIVGNKMIVRLHHSKATTLRTASIMQITNNHGDLAVSFPREPGHGVEVRHEDVKVQAEPVQHEVAAAKVENAEKVEAPKAEKVEASKAEAPKVEAKEEAKAAEPVAALAPAVKEAPIQFADEPSHGSGRLGSAIVIVILGAVAAIAAMLRKKAKAQVADEPFKIIASKTLGPKAKIFMVEVEGKKLLFTVDEKGTRLVQTFGKNEDAKMAAGPSFEEELGIMNNETPVADEPVVSPAVAGLLKLRERHGIDTFDASDADGELKSDTDWAAMLLRATNRRGQS